MQYILYNVLFSVNIQIQAAFNVMPLSALYFGVSCKGSFVQLLCIAYYM
jgi:hypothetical protein